MTGKESGNSTVGSVLVVGGQGGTPTCEQSGTCQCGAGATGTSSAVRFVPGT